MENETFLILMLVGVFAGFVDSAVGGGGLLRLPAMLSAGLPPHVALGTNKLASAAAAAVASAKYLQSEIVPRKAAFVGWICMILFSIIGTTVVLSVSADMLLGIVIVVLSTLFFYVLFNPQFGKEEDIKEEKVIPVTVGMGAGLGFYEGFLGPGTGSMLMAGYIKGAGFGMDRAAATARILNFGGNIGSLAVFALAASVNYSVAIPFALANMIGGYLAPGYVLKYGYSLLRPMFLIVSAFMIIVQINAYFG
ncbi:MAG: TSUP family transporter [Candidatus Thermoplasmatota archaeon]|nr:TSUP family transporter [Candidatus Thermoplasmatota archaeon]